ncbi:MAG TPA: enoyl-CoA hydratase-related protein [Candidatus Binataceae bacterium]
MAYSEIIYSKADRVATITLNRPASYNAWTPTMSREMRDAFGDADNDNDVGAIIFTGAGKAFCAGADMSLVGNRANSSNDPPKRESPAPAAARPPRKPGLLPYMRGLRTPVIGAINGVAAGIGFTMPLYFDFRIAGQSARLGTIFSRRGLTIEDATGYLLPRIVGLANAIDLIITGRMINAEEALKMGYLREVVPDDQLMARAHEIAHDIAHNCSAISVAQSKRILFEHLNSDLEAVLRDTDETTAWMYSLPDIKEGVKAFAEKRPPRFATPKTLTLPKKSDS